MFRRFLLLHLLAARFVRITVFTFVMRIGVVVHYATPISTWRYYEKSTCADAVRLAEKNEVPIAVASGLQRGLDLVVDRNRERRLEATLAQRGSRKWQSPYQPDR